MPRASRAEGFTAVWGAIAGLTALAVTGAAAAIGLVGVVGPRQLGIECAVELAVCWGDDVDRVDIAEVLDAELPQPPIGEAGEVAFDIPAGDSVFWSGRTPLLVDGETEEVGSGPLAAGLAEEHGAVTLELYLAEHRIPMPAWDGSDAVAEAWSAVSEEFAESASGDVYVVLGTELRPGNTWETTEFPELRANPAVSRVIRIDPSTGAMTVIFNRRSAG